METNDVQQRSRFIWTNITILKENIKQLTTQNIYLHKLPKFIGRRSKFYKDNIGKKVIISFKGDIKQYYILLTICHKLLKIKLLNY